VAIQPICLPTAEAPHYDRIFEAAGWGNGSPVLVRKFLKENLPDNTYVITRHLYQNYKSVQVVARVEMIRVKVILAVP